MEKMLNNLPLNTVDVLQPRPWLLSLGLTAYNQLTQVLCLLYFRVLCEVPYATYHKLLLLGSAEPSIHNATDHLLQLLLSQQTTHTDEPVWWDGTSSGTIVSPPYVMCKEFYGESFIFHFLLFIAVLRDFKNSKENVSLCCKEAQAFY